MIKSFAYIDLDCTYAGKQLIYLLMSELEEIHNSIRFFHDLHEALPPPQNFQQIAWKEPLWM